MSKLTTNVIAFVSFNWVLSPVHPNATLVQIVPLIGFLIKKLRLDVHLLRLSLYSHILKPRWYGALATSDYVKGVSY